MRHLNRCFELMVMTAFCAAPVCRVGAAPVNQPPSAPTVAIVPESPGVEDDLICILLVASTDPDGDVVEYNYQWYVDGSLYFPAGGDVDMIPASETSEGEFWECVVTPTDGVDIGPSGSASVLIGNEPSAAEAMPISTILFAPAPNPFNPQTTIRFDIPQDGQVTLRIYDVRGALVRVLVDEALARGSHQATWDGRDTSGRAVASGSYFARLEAQGKVETVRMSLVR